MVKVMRMVVRTQFGEKHDTEGMYCYSFNLSALFCDLKKRKSCKVCIYISEMVLQINRGNSVHLLLFF